MLFQAKERFILGRFKMIKSMEMVLLYRKRIFMKVNIKIIYEYMEVKKIEMEFILANF
jgi:hypothetical protein